MIRARPPMPRVVGKNPCIIQAPIQELAVAKFKKGQSGNPAGKPKGTRHKISLLTERARMQLAEREGIEPLQFLMSVMRDPKASLDYQLEAAKIAAPYLHRKMPISIEGGDPTRPIVTLDAAQLRNLNKTELTALRALLAKLGMQTEVGS